MEIMSRAAERDRVRRLRIRLAALRRHEAARNPITGKSDLAVAAGQASERKREGDRVWELESALKRWHPKTYEKAGVCTTSQLAVKLAELEDSRVLALAR